MRLMVLGLVLLGATAHAQVKCPDDCATAPAVCCNVPQADTFMALESNTHNGPIFRGVVPNTAGATCDVTTNITVVPPVVVNGPLAPVQVHLSPTVELDFELGEGTQKWEADGGEFGGGPGEVKCFTPEVKGLGSLHGTVISVTDGCGTHMVTVGRPAFFCVGPAFKFMCFESKNVGLVPPLPIGFDRAEDLCAIFS